MKRILACTLLALPFAVTSLPTQVKAAEAVSPTSVTAQSTVPASYEIARWVREWVRWTLGIPLWNAILGS